MKCPDCSAEVISWPRFVFKVYPRQLVCGHCGSVLVWTDAWRRVFHRSLVVWILGALIMSLFRHAVGMSLLAYIIVGLVLALIFDTVFWRRARYEKEAIS